MQKQKKWNRKIHISALLALFVCSVLEVRAEDANVSTGVNESVAIPTKYAKRIQGLQQEREGYLTQLDEVRLLIARTTAVIEKAKAKRTETASSRVSKRQALVDEMHTILMERESTLQKIITMLDRRIATVQEQEILEVAIPPILPVKSLYTFDDVQLVTRSFMEVKSQLADEDKQRVVTLDELAKRKKAATVAEEEYQAKKLEQEQFATSDKYNKNGSSSAQQGEILDVEERIAWYKRELALSRVQESEHRLHNVDAHIVILKAHSAALRKEVAQVKKTTRVTQEYVEAREKQIEQRRQETVVERERSNEKVRLIAERESRLQRILQEVQRKFSLTPADIAHIRALSKEPRTIAEWKAYVTVLSILVDESLFRIESEFFAAHGELAKAQFRTDELDFMIIKSWNRMTTHESRFRADEEVEQEIKTYATIKVELESYLSSLLNARDTAIVNVHQFNVNFEKLKALADVLTQHSKTIFRDATDEYYAVAHKIDVIEEKIRNRFDWVARLIELYSTNIAVLSSNEKMVDGIIHELTSRSFWRRSDLSIDWEALSTFLPDMRLFAHDVKNSVQEIIANRPLMGIATAVVETASNSLQLLLLIVNIILIVTVFLLLRLYLPDIAQYIGSIGQGYWVIHGPAIAIAALLGFVSQHVVGIYCWSLIFALIQLRFIQDPHIAQLFYLATIPYALWLVHRMIMHWKEVNRERKFLLVSENYERRFFGIISTMLSVLVTVSLIREAFIMGGYQHSQVPTILLAVLFILGQISLIGLIGRAQILGLLRSDTPLWQWVYDHVNRYYYAVCIVLIFVIVMSNPYVGYGRQVFYVIVRILFTLSLLPIFSWLHSKMKRAALDLFFYYADRDVIKERFVTGRFWYSVAVVVSLLVFVISGIYIAARVWGAPLSLRDMVGWLHYPLYNPVDENGRELSVTLLSLLQVIWYIVGGFVVAYAFNNFVLSRVLDPFIVDSGVQNTVMTLVRYFAVTIAVFMGLTSAGLEGLTTKLALLLAGVGFAVKDLVRDFFSYFILLVQRPVKVGDFIRVLDPLSRDEDVSLMGFVRSITPRSIVIRKRNSTTVVVPNSRVVMNPVMNWSYTRGFFAFDDMRITVPYNSDPVLVRQLFLDVLDKNPNVLKNPAPIVRLDEFVDNGYRFLLRGFLTSHKISEQWDIASDIRLQLVKALYDAGIEVASPVRTVRVLGGEQSFLSPMTQEEPFDPPHEGV